MHRSLCRPARTPPEELWNDRGLGGTPGSLWIVNNLQCVWATKGYNPPQGTASNGAFWELRDWPLRLDDVGESDDEDSLPFLS